MPEMPFNATLVRRSDMTDELSIVHVRPDSGVAPAFKPGQFIKLGLPRDEHEPPALGARPRSGPRMVRRAYSIASAAGPADALEFLVARVAEGKLTPKLWTVEEGGRLWMDDAAEGHFTLERVPPDRDLIMIATGTGVAPFVSMLRTFRAAPPWHRALLVNGVRYAADLSYRDELEALASDPSRLVYVPVVSREPEGSPWAGLRGRVQQVLEPTAYRSLTGSPLDPTRCHVMLCGNPLMIESTAAMLCQQGFCVHEPGQPGNIHFERYW